MYSVNYSIMHRVVVCVLVLSCAVGCPFSGHYSLGIMFVLLFSLCVQYYSLMSVLSADQSWYIAVAAVLYDQLSVAFNQSQLLLLSPPP